MMSSAKKSYLTIADLKVKCQGWQHILSVAIFWSRRCALCPWNSDWHKWTFLCITAGRTDLQGVFWCSAFNVVVFPLGGDSWEINKFYNKIYVSSINILSCSGELYLFCLRNWRKGLSDSYAVSHIPEYHPETTVPTSAQPLLPVANPNPRHGGAEPSLGSDLGSGLGSHSTACKSQLLSRVHRRNAPYVHHCPLLA